MDPPLTPKTSGLHERTPSNGTRSAVLNAGLKRTASVNTTANPLLKGQENQHGIANGVTTAMKAKTLNGSSTVASSATAPLASKFGFRPKEIITTAAPIAAPLSIHTGSDSADIASSPPVPLTPSSSSTHSHLHAPLPSPPRSPITLGACDQITSLFKETILDPSTESEMKSALAGKISAAKFDYKERITQLETQMKVLRKVMTTLMKKQDTFLEGAQSIEKNWAESLMKEKQFSRDFRAQTIDVTNKLHKSMDLLRATQAQRDKTLAEMKSNVTQMNAHASILSQKDSERAEIQSQLNQCQADLNETRCMLKGTQSEREECRRLLSDLQVMYDELSITSQSTEQEKMEMHEKYLVQAQKSESLGQEKFSLEQALEDVKNKYEDLQTQWAQLSKQSAKNEELIIDYKNKLSAVQSQLQDTLALLDNTRRELSESQHALVTTKSQHTYELSTLRTTFQRESEQLKQQMDQAISTNQAELQAVKAEFDATVQAKNSLMEQYQKSNIDLTTLRTNLLHSTSRISSSELETKKLEGDLALLKLQLEKKNEECFMTVQNFGAIQKFHEERQCVLQGEKEVLEKGKQEMMLKLAAMESTGRSTQALLDSTVIALQEKTTSLDTLKMEHDKLILQSASEKKEYESQLTEMKTSHAAALAELTTKLAAGDAEILLLKERLSSESLRADNTSRELTSFKALSGVSDSSQMENLVKLSIETETLRAQVADRGAMSSKLSETQRLLQDALKKLADSEVTRRSLHNTIQELRGNIRVFTRVRPMFHAGADVSTTEGSGEDMINAVEVSSDGKKLRLDTGSGGAKQSYSFDNVFGPSSTQKDIFDEISQLVQSALDGYHVCLFSYGQTGSGKTHTMSGTTTGDERGIIPRSVEKVLEQANIMSSSASASASGWTYVLEASFLEIYNETIRDLLVSSKEAKDSTDLDIKRDTAGRTTIPGLTKLPIQTMQDVVAIMTRASKNRSTAATNMNERSSRSHSVFTLYLSASNPMSKATIQGSLNLCDLAGSERLSKSGAGADAARLKETQSINKSLSSLADVFLSLSQKSSHVPYRNSKLTYLLQPCLSGDGKTAMIVNLNPALSSANESQCTLRFAAQVSQVELGKPKKSASSSFKSGEDSPSAIDTSLAQSFGSGTANSSPAPSPTSSGRSSPALSGSFSFNGASGVPVSRERSSSATSGIKKPATSSIRPPTTTRR